MKSSVPVLSLTTQFSTWLVAHSFPWVLSPDCFRMESTPWEMCMAASLQQFPAACKPVQQPLKLAII